MAETTRNLAAALLMAASTFGTPHAQTPGPPAAAPLAFDVVSIKPAAPGTFPIVPAFMRDKGVRIRGQQTMAAPVWMTIAFAYSLQMNEAKAAIEKQPDWVKDRIYTETFRAEGEPTLDQVREMTRTMLAERFGLQVHEFTRQGAVNKLVLKKPGVLGPNLKPHTEGAPCSRQDENSAGQAPDPSQPTAILCGFHWYYLSDRLLHISITDTTVVNAARSIAGMGTNELSTRPIVDGTGLTGKYDMTLAFLPSTGNLLSDPDADGGAAPTLIQALKEQLGLRMETAQGPVKTFVIDHIAEPTPN